MTFELPEDLFQQHGYSEKDFRVDIAITLYQRKVASIRRAALLSGLLLSAFEHILEERKNVPISKEATHIYPTATDKFLTALEPDSPLRRAIKPVRKTITLEELIIEQNYKGTDWTKLNAMAKELDIQEPIELLLAQLME